MLRAFALVVVAMVISVNGARADWQFTKWGMNPAQVAKASKNNAVPASPDVAQEGYDYSLRAGVGKLMMPYSTGGLAFTAVFMFDPTNHLQAVILLKRAGEDRELIDALRARYGATVRDEPTSIGSILEWVSATDRIRFASALSHTWVLYSPRTAGAAQGL
jgi:hypothetical protein